MMKNHSKWLTTLLMLVICNFASAESTPPYKIQQGDVVSISVWGETALQKEMRVLPDGSITFPLAGRIDVAGSTTVDTEKNIAQKLKTFFPEPQVSVMVTASEGSRIYIIGKVLKPGPISATSPMTVLQALSMAGGLDRFSDANAIKILRMTEKGQEIYPVPYERLLRGEELNTNIQLNIGDTILVP